VLKKKTVESVVAVANAIQEATDSANKLRNEAASAQVLSRPLSWFASIILVRVHYPGSNLVIKHVFVFVNYTTVYLSFLV
jgi:hypothetical protein